MTKYIIALVLLTSFSLASCERTETSIIGDVNSSTGEIIKACQKYRNWSSKDTPVICFQYITE